MSLGLQLSERRRRKQEKKDREKELLLRTQARADLTRSFNDLQLGLQPNENAEDKAGRFREVLNEHVGGLRQEHPEQAAELEAWGRAYIAPQIEAWRNEDTRRYKEQVANTAATRVGQLERDLLPATVASVAGQTPSERQEAAARLIEGRKELLEVLAEVDPETAEVRAGELEVSLATDALGAIANDALARRRGADFLDSFDRGDYKSLTVAMKPDALAAFRDRHIQRIARNAALREEHHAATETSDKARKELMVEQAVRASMSGEALDTLKAGFFEAGGDTASWKKALDRINGIEAAEGKLTGREAAAGYRANEMVFERSMLTMADVDDANAAEVQLLDLFGAGQISKEYKDNGIDRINARKEMFKYDDAQVRRAWTQRVVEPLLARKGVGPAGYIDTEVNAEFIQWFELLEPELYAVAREGGVSELEMQHFRDFAWEAWSIQDAAMMYTPIEEGEDLDAATARIRGEGMDKVKGLIRTMTRAGYVKSADTRSLNAIAVQALGPMLTAESPLSTGEDYMAFNESGEYDEFLTLDKMESMGLPHEQRLEEWVAIQRRMGLINAMRGLPAIPTPTEVRRDREAESFLTNDAALQEAQLQAGAQGTMAPGVPGRGNIRYRSR